MLQSWFQDLPDDYVVKDLINEIKDWVDDGYVESTIWKRLKKHVAADKDSSTTENVAASDPELSERNSPQIPSESLSSSGSTKKENKASSRPSSDVLGSEKGSEGVTKKKSALPEDSRSPQSQGKTAVE